VTRPFVWLPEAREELREALAHYQSIRPELAQNLQTPFLKPSTI
jgi:hypothetical protein